MPFTLWMVMTSTLRASLRTRWSVGWAANSVTMPCEFLIDVNRRLVISGGTGTFRYRDFLEHMEKLALDPRFKPEFDHVVDCRKFEQLDLTAGQVENMGGRSVFAATSRRAVVVSSDLQFGLGRMFAAFREANFGQVTMVFKDLREALVWLGLSPNYDPGNLVEPTRIGEDASVLKSNG
jgi:hypothetical protein